MKVRDIMQRNVRCTHTDASLAAAGRAMQEAGCGVLPVVGESGEVLGMITDRDVCLALAQRDRLPSQVSVGEVLGGAVHSCLGSDDVRDALRVMRERRVRRLPVLDREGRVEGILSIDDIVLYARGGAALVSEHFDGPFYADIALTLKGICEPALGAPA